MKMNRFFGALLACLACFSLSLAAADYPIALVSDPPPAIDGGAERLAKLPTFQRLADPQKIIFGKQNHTGADDLSGEVVVAYDKNNLYMAAQVRDDTHRQSWFGADLWKGDHLMLVVDYPRQTGDQPDLSKVFRIGLSPGDFRSVKPEAYLWSPAGLDASEIRLAAQKTVDGYTIEAAVPWKLLKITPEQGMELGLDLLLSDSDGDFQDTLLSLSGDTSVKQAHHPERLLTGVLADANGRIAPELRRSLQAFEILPEQSIPQLKSIRVPIPDDQAAKMKELIVYGRLAQKYARGATYAMQLKFNGKLLTLEQVRNRAQKLYFRHFIVAPVTQQGLWYTPYAPDFDMRKSEPFRSGGATINPYEFRFNIEPLKKSSGNELEIIHAKALPRKNDLFVKVAGSAVLSPELREANTMKPAPTGELPVIAPTPPLRTALYQAELTPGGALAVRRGGDRLVVASEFSTRTPGWAVLGDSAAQDQWLEHKVSGSTFRGKTAEFALERSVSCRAEQIRVTDRITNLSQDLLPVMYRHIWTNAPEGEFRGAGYEVKSDNYATQSGEHPVAAMLSGANSGAIVGEDDLTRAQAMIFRRKNTLGLENRSMVVAPGKTAEIEYSFYPLEKADYFLLVNRIRRDWDVNFTIPACGAFVPARQVGRWNDAQLRQFLEGKSVDCGFAMDNVPIIKGVVTHGTRLREVDMESSRKFRQRMARLFPNAKSSIYYHCFIANGSRDKEEFAADAILNRSGVQADYSSGYPLFLPMEGNAFAKRQEELIDERYQLGIKGIFWDEFDYSMNKYDYNPAHWDGVSAIIDLKSHRIVRKVTNVTLATLPWRKRIAEKIMRRGHLIGNGAPQTRTFTRLKFPRFVETGSISNLVLSQLYTPIALGDHLSERNEFDAYRNMVKGLDYGAVYFYYRAEVKPTHHTLTKYMYPVTPVELGHGFLIGRERILTNRSGLFTWGDKCGMDVHVFDREGLETKYPVKVFDRDNVTCAEVRIPEGYSVALVRKEAAGK